MCVGNASFQQVSFGGFLGPNRFQLVTCWRCWYQVNHAKKDLVKAQQNRGLNLAGIPSCNSSTFSRCRTKTVGQLLLSISLVPAIKKTLVPEVPGLVVSECPWEALPIRNQSRCSHLCGCARKRGLPPRSITGPDQRVVWGLEGPESSRTEPESGLSSSYSLRLSPVTCRNLYLSSQGADRARPFVWLLVLAFPSPPRRERRHVHVHVHRDRLEVFVRPPARGHRR